LKCIRCGHFIQWYKKVGIFINPCVTWHQNLKTRLIWSIKSGHGDKESVVGLVFLQP
jgi:hypothetical protein